MSKPSRPRVKLPFNGWHLLLMPTALIFAFPLVWMILTSFMPNGDINRFPPRFWPSEFTFSGYSGLFTGSDIVLWFRNSALVSAVSILSQLVLCSMAGYGFARLKFTAKNVLFMLIVATIMIPTQLLMIPNFVMFSRLGIVNTLLAAMVPWLTGAFGIFLMRQFFLSIPVEVEEAARIDGANRWQVFWHIVLPLAKPALATLAILAFLSSWNDLVWPLVAISDEKLYTLQLGLANFQGQRRTEWQLLMAGNVVALMPVLIGFVVAQKHFVATMASAGLKG